MTVTLRNPIYLAALPLMIPASCVPPAGWSAQVAADIAVPEASAEALPPPSSLGRLAPEEEARWQQAAGQFTAPSAAPALPFQHEGDTVARTRALDCLANAIYYEARSESGDGQRAVAQVVLNRVRHAAFPASVCGVVYQGSTRRTGCQFSFTCDGSLARRPYGSAWERARTIAAAALAGQVYAPVGNATHYHTTAILPYWAPSLTRSAVIGAHIFYRWRGAAGRSAAFRQAYSGSEGVRVQRAAATIPFSRPAGDGTAVETVRDGARTIKIHRGGPAASQGAAARAGVRVHVGVAPPAAAEAQLSETSATFSS